jgi:protein SCO1/2/putative membrane protein
VDEEARLPNWAFWGLLLAVGSGITAWAGWTWLAAPGQAQSVADFQLIDRGGKAVTRHDLHGKVWVAGFVFTRCTLSCPRITEAMAQLQKELRHTDIHFVCISVDPEHDTPEVLQRYAAAWQADPARWWFLTGAKEQIAQLMESSFLPRPQLSEQADPGRRILHSNRLVLVDRAGGIRGTYLAVSPAVGTDGQLLEDVFAINDRDIERLRQDAVELAEGQFIRLALLPTVNAILNGTSAVLLTLGYLCIRRRLVQPHIACMVGALVVSTLFLVSYLYYHFHRLSTPFQGQGWIRPIYFGILLSHTVLAAVTLPLVLWTVYHAVRKQYAKHVRVARWTLPIWLYVSVTGVLVYLFLYQLYAT